MAVWNFSKKFIRFSGANCPSLRDCLKSRDACASKSGQFSRPRLKTIQSLSKFEYLFQSMEGTQHRDTLADFFGHFSQFLANKFQ